MVTLLEGVVIGGGLLLGVALGSAVIRSGSAPAGPAIATELFYAYDPAELQTVLTKWPGLMRAGDRMDNYHAQMDAASIAAVNALTAKIQAAMPAGVLISQNSICVPSYQYAGPNLTGNVSILASTYEPDGASRTHGCPYPYTFSDCVSYFRGLNTVAHANGKKSLAYVTGGPLWRTGLLPYAWDYGTICSLCDRLTVELQDVATTSSFPSVLSKLVGQLQAKGQPLSKLEVQIDIGINPHGTFFTDVPSAVAAVHTIQTYGIQNVYIWVNEGYEDLGLQVLQALRP